MARLHLSVEPEPAAAVRTPEASQSSELPRWTFWVLFVRGVVAFTLGTSLLLSGSGLTLLGSFVGGYWVVGGLLTLGWVATHYTAPGKRLGTLVGLIGIAAGLVLIFRGLIEELIEQGILLDVIGITAIGMGILRLSGKFHDDQLEAHRPRARYRLVVGTMDIVLGVAVILVSAERVSDIRVLLGIWGLLVGTFLVLDALRLRRFERARKGAL